MSGGFFDLWNLPPWDTWIAYGRQPTAFDERSMGSFLISWVPQRFFDYAQAGIDINPEHCMRWLDDFQLARLLADAGMP